MKGETRDEGSGEAEGEGQEGGGAGEEGGGSAEQEDVKVGAEALRCLCHDLAAGAAGGDRFVRSVLGTGGDGKGKDAGSGVSRGGGEKGDALGAKPGGIGGVLLVAAGDDFTVVEQDGGADGKAGIGAIGTEGGVAGSGGKGFVATGKFFAVKGVIYFQFSFLHHDFFLILHPLR